MKIKNITAILCFLILGIANTNAQDMKATDVPMIVKTSFNSKYANAVDIDWELRGGNYGVSFDIANVDHKMLIAKNGDLISHQKEIPKNQLPTVIAKSIKIKYPGSRIDEVDWINTNGKITYRVDIEGKFDLDVWYSADGKFIKEVID